MGKDFTPREHHMADIMYGFSRNRTVMRDADGNETVLYDPHSPASVKYPNLSFLFGSGLADILEEFGSGAGSVLSDIEKRLVRIIEADSGEKDDQLYLWYIGKLDPDFYYNTWNNELLREYIVSLVRSDKKEESAC